jgi:hypothetical protein
MIAETSRYVNSAIDVVTDERGTHQSMNTVPPQDMVFEFTYYQIAAFDRPDTLAAFLYDDGGLWWVIANANPEILDWSQMKAGDIIRVPTL